MIRSGRSFFFAAISASILSTGCSGWVTGGGGPVYSADGNQGRTGGAVSLDGMLTPKPHTVFNHGNTALPVAYHNGFEGIFTPDQKSFGWQTGLALYWLPRPVSGFLVVGTDLHVDEIDGFFSFGNFQPYAQIGLVTSLGEGKHAPIFTLTAQGEYFINYLTYLHDNEPKTDTFLTLKFGFGFELQ
ncbi:MAG: hypothetical protein ABI183_08860 [Polyangiaceae bacterium]